MLGANAIKRQIKALENCNSRESVILCDDEVTDDYLDLLDLDYIRECDKSELSEEDLNTYHFMWLFHPTIYTITEKGKEVLSKLLEVSHAKRNA